MKSKYIFLLLIPVCLFLSINSAYGQSAKKAVKSTISHLKETDLQGTWSYEGVSVQFESKNLLKKAGGKVATSRIEKNLNEELEKIGFESGITTFTFNEDGTFTNTINGKSINGKYTYDHNTKYITLKYMNHIPIKAKISGSGNAISLLFQANSFLSMVTFIGSHSGVSVLKGITSILNSYDGMLVGMQLKR